MELVTLSEKEYLKYASTHPYLSIYELPNWGKLKKTTNWNYYLLGLKDKNKIVGCTLLLEKKVLKIFNLFYAPRGFLVDMQNEKLLKNFHQEMIKFIKQKKGFMLKIDPNVIYDIKDKNGNLLEVVGQKEFDNLINLNYKHYGFNQNFETLQPRNLCRIKISDYEATFASFSKSTQKNTIQAQQMGVKTRAIKNDEIELFVSLLNDTATRQNFIIRPTWYYQKMYELFPNETIFYVTYLDTKVYLAYVQDKLNSIKQKKEEITTKINTYANVGKKLQSQLESLEKQEQKTKTELQEAKNLAKEKQIYLGALMSIFLNNEGITFMSGTKNEYKKFNIKYDFYNTHIKEAIKRKLAYVNFYGISNDLDSNNPYYNIYEIKKGYNPEIIELLGEFDYIISYPKYYLYKLLFFVYKKLKKLKH